MTARGLEFMRAALEETGQPPDEARAHAIAGYGVYLGLAALHRITRRRPFRLLLAYALTEMCPTS